MQLFTNDKNIRLMRAINKTNHIINLIIHSNLISSLLYLYNMTNKQKISVALGYIVFITDSVLLVEPRLEHVNRLVETSPRGVRFV